MKKIHSATKKLKPKKIEQTHFNFTKTTTDGKFQLPPFTLLEEAQHKDARVKRDNLITNSRILEKKLSDFGVEGACYGSHARPGYHDV